MSFDDAKNLRHNPGRTLVNEGPARGRRRRATIYIHVDSIVLNQRRCMCEGCLAIFAEKSLVEREMRRRGMDPWQAAVWHADETDAGLN